MSQVTRNAFDHVASGRAVGFNHQKKLLESLRSSVLTTVPAVAGLISGVEAGTGKRPVSPAIPCSDPPLATGGSQSLRDVISFYKTSDRLKQCSIRDEIFSETSVDEFLSDLDKYDLQIGVGYKFRRKYWRELVRIAEHHRVSSGIKSSKNHPLSVRLQSNSSSAIGVTAKANDRHDQNDVLESNQIKSDIDNNAEQGSDNLRAIILNSGASSKLKSIAKYSDTFLETSASEFYDNLSIFRVKFKSIIGFEDDTWLELKGLVRIHSSTTGCALPLGTTREEAQGSKIISNELAESTVDYIPVPDFLQDLPDHSSDEDIIPLEVESNEKTKIDKPTAQVDFFVPVQQTLKKMIEIQGASVRLSNCAERESIFEEVTVEQFLADREGYEKRFQGLWAFGAKTRRELRTLAINFAMETPIAIPPSAVHSESVSADEGDRVRVRLVLRDDVRALSVKEVVAIQGAGVRLTNCMLKDHESTCLTIGDYVDNPDTFRNKIFKIPAFGRRTFKELTEAIDGILKNTGSYVDAVHDSELSQCSRTEVSSLTPEQVAAFTTTPVAAIEDDELQGWLLARIAELPDNRRTVIERRYGLLDGKTETLEEIAKTVHVTRERVRQVERDGLKKLRERNGSENAERLLNIVASDAWDQLSQKCPLVTEDDIRARKGALDPLFHLVVDLVHAGLAAWINDYAEKTFGGWISPWVDQNEVLKLRRVIPDVIKNTVFPCPVEIFSKACPCEVESNESLEVALLLTNGMGIHEGYVCQGAIGPVAKRTIALHRLAECLDGPVFDISRITHAYRLANPDDVVSSRVMRMAFNKNPNLFGCLYDNLWYGIPLRNGGIASLPTMDVDIDCEVDREHTEGSMGGWLIQILQDNGPMRMADIIEKAKLEPSADMTLNSLGPIMLMSPCFERSANGVFALSGAVDDYMDIDVKPASCLLNETQCRHVALAMYGETNWKLFPAWTDAFSYHLCIWARHGASREAFRSLLYVVDPNRWDVSSEERTKWMQAKAHLGEWQIGSGRSSPLGSGFPRARDILPCLLFLRMNRAIGWLATGRVAKIPFGHQTSMDTLAFLTAIGAVAAPEDDWQRAHYVTDRAGEIILRIEDEMLSGKEPDWDTGYMSELLAQAEDFDPEGTWIGRKELASMLQMRSRSSIGFGRSKEVDDVEDLIASDDWAAIFSDQETVAA